MIPPPGVRVTTSGSEVRERAPQAEFVERARCIACASPDLSELSRGRFSDQPLRAFIEADPWGESPLPHLEQAEWVLVRCRHCEQVFHRRVLSEEWNQRRFTRWMSAEAIAEFEARLARTQPGRTFDKARDHVAHVLRLEKLTRSLRDMGPVRLLDFGCGWGQFLLVCQQFGFDACGVDRSTARAERSLVKILASLEELAGRPRFHVITLFEVLEHLDDPAAILRALGEWIVPGGLLVLETPDCAGVTGIRTHDDYLKVHPLDHINAFTHATLTAIAQRHGFDPISRGVAYVTADRERLVKAEAKHLLGRDARSTQLYFRRR